MHHVAEPLDHEALGHVHTAEFGHAPNIVPAKVEQHQMFRPLLGIGEQLGFERRVFFVCGAPPAGPGERTERNRRIPQPHQDFRRGADDREAAEIQKK